MKVLIQEYQHNLAVLAHVVNLLIFHSKKKKLRDGKRRCENILCFNFFNLLATMVMRNEPNLTMYQDDKHT